MPTLGIILAAGGASRRFGGNKLLAEYRGKPLIRHSLDAFAPLGAPTVLVVSAAHEAEYRAVCPEAWLVRGGTCRAESVLRGLEALLALPDPPQYIAVHDAARPLATADLLRRCLEAASKCGGAIAAHSVTDTIHIASGTPPDIAATPDRAALWAAETPQVFRADLLLRAYRDLDWRNNPPTDEAALVGRLPGTVIRLVANPSPNPKITFPSDLTPQA